MRHRLMARAQGHHPDPANVAVFDPEIIADRATYTDPHRFSVGISNLLVNGVPVILDHGITGERPGRWIRGPVQRPIS